MNRPVSPVPSSAETIGGFALAAATLCGGFYLSLKIPVEPAATWCLRAGWWMAAAIVMNFTFGWGRASGFATRREDGAISLSNLLRNLAAAAIAMLAVLWVSGPIIGLLVRAAR